MMQKESKNQNRYTSIADVLTKINNKLNASSKSIKHFVLSEKGRIQMDHFFRSIANYMQLIQDQVTLIINKNAELENRITVVQTMYEDYREKFLNSEKEARKELDAVNYRLNKLTKQNEYLSFINKGLKQQIEEKKKYWKEFKEHKNKQIKQFINNVELEVKNGAQKVCEALTKFIDCWEQEMDQQFLESNKTEIPQNADLTEVEKQGLHVKQISEFLTASTAKKKSLSLNNKETQSKKKKIENKLAKIVIEQAKLCQKNERYLQSYL